MCADRDRLSGYVLQRRGRPALLCSAADRWTSSGPGVRYEVCERRRDVTRDDGVMILMGSGGEGGSDRLELLDFGCSVAVFYSSLQIQTRITRLLEKSPSGPSARSGACERT